MIKSKYAIELEIEDNIYAIYNNLIMKPIFVDKKFLLNINNNELTAQEIDELKKIGYFIENSTIDKKILETYENIFNSQLKDNITLMYIIPTNTCNLGCKYCFIGSLLNNQIKMTDEILYKSIRLFNKQLNNNKGTILFYGGEPLMNFDIVKKAVEYCKLNNYNNTFSMVTNGLLINEEIADFIKENNISVGISLDGPKELTNKNRVYKNSTIGTYDDVIEKLKVLKNKQVDFGLSITLSKDFIKYKDAFIEWIKEIDVKNISYNLLHFTDKDPEWEKYYEEASKFIYHSNNILFSSGYNEDRIKRKYDAFYNRNFKFADCAAIGGNQITINPSGDIDICHGLWNNKSNHIKNILDIDDLKEIKSTEQYDFWKNNLTINKKECLSCPAIYECGGGCALQAKDLFDDIRGIDRGICVHSKFLLKYILKEVYKDSTK